MSFFSVCNPFCFCNLFEEKLIIFFRKGGWIEDKLMHPWLHTVCVISVQIYTCVHTLHPRPRCPDPPSMAGSSVVVASYKSSGRERQWNVILGDQPNVIVQVSNEILEENKRSLAAIAIPVVRVGVGVGTLSVCHPLTSSRLPRWCGSLEKRSAPAVSLQEEEGRWLERSLFCWMFSSMDCTFALFPFLSFLLPAKREEDDTLKRYEKYTTAYHHEK